MGKSCVRFKKLDDIPYSLIGELMKKMSVKDWIDFYEMTLKKQTIQNKNGRNKRCKSPTNCREVDWFLIGILFIEKQAVVSLFSLTNSDLEFESYNPLKLKETQF